jgi:phospholipid-binding lipoprotein MlaA
MMAAAEALIRAFTDGFMPHPGKKILLLCLWTLIPGGCATVSGPTDPQDPWESFNRSMYSFNTRLDNTVLKPVAKGYRAITPDPVETGVTNFFSNLEEVRNLVSNLLQFKPLAALSDTGRLAVNTTIGIGGLFDVATPLGLSKHNEDTGQTLGRWGMGPGPYLVLPFFGPSSPRDAFGLAADYTLDPLREVEDTSTRYGLYVIEIIDIRAQLLAVDDIIDEAALDPYIYIRDAWLQRRRSLVYDGEPPPDTSEEIDIFSDDE